MKACPYCAEKIQDAAIVCKHCRRDLVVEPPSLRFSPYETQQTASVVSSAPTSSATKNKRSAGERIAIGVGIVFAAVFGVPLLFMIVYGIATSSSSSPTSREMTATESNAEMEAKARADRHQVWNAIQTDKDRAAIAQRYSRSMDELTAIEAEGARLHWKVEDPYPTTATDRPTAPLEAAGLTYENYLRLAEGMTYAEVVAILGSNGKEISRSDIAGYTTVMYSWQKFGGANATAMFQNGRLMTKAQFGLN